MITQGEKRNFIRMAVDAEVTIKRLNGSGLLVGRCINLSATGLLAEVTERLSVGESVELFIASTSEGVRPLEASATVQRVEANDTDMYEIGLVITNYI
ncbi:PilZ domain-containing protein [Echinimonas agarilytica]|uniref:PilZ domain-containing protein n=1 Tax=Echinimonas agarilytica TaxID=1215918 RepID=A0AA41W3V4_9GAMM|nr:PilZ domain-containing protein [Echinimonas agarilytica]MCM2678336.1 PilZ domain-containing protein [Echinimonas agarilytica]